MYGYLYGGAYSASPYYYGGSYAAASPYYYGGSYARSYASPYSYRAFGKSVIQISKTLMISK